MIYNEQIAFPGQLYGKQPGTNSSPSKVFFGNVAIFWKGRVYRLAVTQFKADYLVWVGVLLKRTVIMVIISKFKAFTNILKFIYFGVLASF